MDDIKTNLNTNVQLLGLEGKHVAMLTRWFSESGGLELYCHRLTEELLKRDTKITVICEENKSEFTHPNLEVIDYGTPFKKISKGDTYRYAFKKTREVLERIDAPDIVHSHQLPSFRHDVVTFHNHTINRLSNVGLGWEKFVNKAKANFADRYQTKMLFDRRLCIESKVRVFVSEIEKDEYYEEFGLDADAPYVIAYPGALSGDVSESEEQSSDDQTPGEYERVEKFPFIFVGKGYRMKGLDVLFKACRILKRDGVDFVLNVVGLDKKPILKAALLRYKIEDCVDFKGFIKDIDNVYKDSYAIVSPSRLESFGMAPLQAMRHGVVPIVSNVCGISEVLENEVDGLVMHDHLNSGELAGLMKKLIVDPDLLRRCAEQARKKADQFTWEKTADATMLAYKEVLQSKKRKTLDGEPVV